MAIVEAEFVGGECSYWAWMPTKALLRDAATLRAVRQLHGAAGAVTGRLAAAVLSRRDRFASHWQDDGQVAWLNAAGITLIRGRGRIAGVRTVSVTAADGTVSTLTAGHAVVIATGSSAALPPIPGLAQACPWTSRRHRGRFILDARLPVRPRPRTMTACLRRCPSGAPAMTAAASFSAPPRWQR